MPDHFQQMTLQFILNDSNGMIRKLANYSTDCLPIQVVFHDLVDSIWIQIPFGTLYVLVLVTGLVANGVTLYCLINSSYQMGLNVNFLISLTMSNLLIGLTSLPFTAVQVFTHNWFLGPHLCHYAPLCQAASIFVNSLTLIAVAVERYMLITRDLQNVEHRGNLVIVSAIWIFGILAASPYAWYMELVKNCPEEVGVPCLCGAFCEEKWPDDRIRLGFGACAFVLQFVLPATVMGFCYWRVKKTVVLGVKRRLRKERLSLMGRQKLIRRRQRTSLVTILLFLCFAVPWLPINILNILRDCKVLHDDLVSISFAFAHLIAMTSILWNPLVYCFHNRQFFVNLCATLKCSVSVSDEVRGAATPLAFLSFLQVRFSSMSSKRKPNDDSDDVALRRRPTIDVSHRRWASTSQCFPNAIMNGKYIDLYYRDERNHNRSGLNVDLAGRTRNLSDSMYVLRLQKSPIPLHLLHRSMTIANFDLGLIGNDIGEAVV